MKKPTAPIGNHLAVLNLFREPDGTVEITVSAGTGALLELKALPDQGKGIIPIQYIEGLIVQAAARIVARTNPNAPCQCCGVHTNWNDGK